jgi:MoaA/NifB/PqqE/SkfB family radical SAM enzyme
METKVKVFDMALYWTVTEYCNFSCPGCCGLSKKTENSYAPEKINIPKLRKTLTKLNKTALFVFTGGEPFMVENIIDAFSEISKKHYFSVVTNLTSNRIKEFAERIDPERILILKASAHILQLEKHHLLDRYFDNFNILQEKGFPVFAEEIAYPVMAEKVEKYKKLFLDRNIELSFQAYRGKWGSNTYPDDYNEDDFKLFNFTDTTANNNFDYYRKGMLCNAGYNVFAVYSSGDIYSCSGVEKYIGNIYKDFKPLKSLIKCPLSFCDCPFSVHQNLLYERAINETNGKINETHKFNGNQYLKSIKRLIVPLFK